MGNARKPTFSEKTSNFFAGIPSKAAEIPGKAQQAWRQTKASTRPVHSFLAHPDTKKFLEDWKKQGTELGVKVEDKLNFLERDIQREVDEALSGSPKLPAFLHEQKPNQDNLPDGYHFYKEAEKGPYKVLLKSGELQQTFLLDPSTPGIELFKSLQPNSDEPVPELPPALRNYLKSDSPYYCHDKKPNVTEIGCGYHFYPSDGFWHVLVKASDTDDQGKVVELQNDFVNSKNARFFFDSLADNAKARKFPPIPQEILTSIEEDDGLIPRPTRVKDSGLSNTIEKLLRKPALEKLDETDIEVYLLDQMIKPFDSKTPLEKLPLHVQGLQKKLEEKLGSHGLGQKQITIYKEVEAAIKQASTDNERELIKGLFKEALPQARRYGDALRAQQKIQEHANDFKIINNVVELTDPNDAPRREEAIKDSKNYDTITRVNDTVKIIESPDESLFKLHNSALRTPRKKDDTDKTPLATETPELIQLKALRGIGNETDHINNKLLAVNELINELEIARQRIIDCNAKYLVEDYKTKERELRQAIEEAYLAISTIKATHAYLQLQGNDFQMLQEQLHHLAKNFTPQLENSISNLKNSFDSKEKPLVGGQVLAFEQKQNGRGVITGGSYNPGTGQYENKVIEELEGCPPKLFHQAVLEFDKVTKEHPGVYGFYDPLGSLYLYGFSAFETDENGMITRVKFKDKNSQERFLRILKGLYENYKKEDHSQANFGAKPGSTQSSATGVHNADEDKNQGGQKVTTMQTEKQEDKLNVFTDTNRKEGEGEEENSPLSLRL